jgi:hypothetical protein
VKGIVFNLLETVVVAEHGEDTWETLLEQARLDGSFTSLGNYPDGYMMGLVSVAARQLQLPEGDVLQWFGRKAMPLLAVRYPTLFGYPSTRSFLLALNSIIHPEVRKLYPGADVPTFDFEVSSDDELIMGYRSSRRLCRLAEGFVEGAAAHFGEPVVFEHRQCMHLGDERCVFHISFGSPV